MRRPAENNARGAGLPPGVLRRRLRSADVAVCGLGGLGSNIAITLARAGVGTLRLIDFDHVTRPNLGRQQYFLPQLGKPKAEAMRETLAAIAPGVVVVASAVRLGAANLVPLLSGARVVCEAFDDPVAKALLVDGVLGLLPGAAVVAASGLAGLGSANDVRTRRLGASRLYVCGDGRSDVAGLGALCATRAMLCAAHQAHMALRIIAGMDDP